MNLAVYMMVATIGVFALGALFALAWSIAAGQWHAPATAALLVFDDPDTDPDE